MPENFDGQGPPFQLRFLGLSADVQPRSVVMALYKYFDLFWRINGEDVYAQRSNTILRRNLRGNICWKGEEYRVAWNLKTKALQAFSGEQIIATHSPSRYRFLSKNLPAVTWISHDISADDTLILQSVLPAFLRSHLRLTSSFKLLSEDGEVITVQPPDYPNWKGTILWEDKLFEVVYRTNAQVAQVYFAQEVVATYTPRQFRVFSKDVPAVTWVSENVQPEVAVMLQEALPHYHDRISRIDAYDRSWDM